MPIYAFGQSKQDSLYQQLKNVQGNELVNTLAELSLSYRTTSTDSVQKYALQAYRLSFKLNDNTSKAKALEVMGMFKNLTMESDSSLYYYKMALETLPNNTNKRLEADIKMGVGGAYYYSEELDKAVEMFTAAATIYEHLGDVRKSAAAYSNIGIILNAVDRDEQASYYFHKALKLSVKHNIITTRLPVLVNMSTLFMKNEKYDSAIYYAQECYNISAQHNMAYGKARALSKLSEAYSGKGLYEKGLASATEGATLYKNMGNEKSLRFIQNKKVIALSGLGKNKQALELALQLLDHAEEGEATKENLLALIHKIYLDLGDTKKALEYYKLYFEEYEKVEKKHNQDVVAELETKYETEKKSREIQALSDKARIQELTIRQQNIVIAISAFVFVITVVFLLLFFRQRNLMRKNELLILQQKFFRAQLNPHFIFNALTGIQKFVMKNDPMKGGSYIAKFSQLMRQVLEHSRDEFISFEEELKSLTNYLDLQQLRFENKFEYSIIVDESIDKEKLKIPPMFAQPFIENAIEHGIATKSDGRIDIHFTFEDEYLKLEIRDNGVGLNEKNNSNHMSRATSITNERLQLLSGKRKKSYNVTVQNIVDENGQVAGVKATLTLPFLI